MQDLPSGMEQLTRQERVVCEFLIEGKTDKEIGAILTISVNTVRTHVNHIRLKLGIGHRGWAHLFEQRPEDSKDNEIPKNHQNGD